MESYIFNMLLIFVGDLLVQQAMAVLAMNFAVSKIKEKLQTQKQVVRIMSWKKKLLYDWNPCTLLIVSGSLHFWEILILNQL